VRELQTAAGVSDAMYWGDADPGMEAGAAPVSMAMPLCATFWRREIPIPLAGTNPDLVSDVFCGLCGGLQLEYELIGSPVLGLLPVGSRCRALGKPAGRGLRDLAFRFRSYGGVSGTVGMAFLRRPESRVCRGKKDFLHRVRNSSTWTWDWLESLRLAGRALREFQTRDCWPTGTDLERSLFGGMRAERARGGPREFAVDAGRRFRWTT